MIVQRINPKAFSDSSAKISQGIVAEGRKFLVVSGQVALDRDGHVIGKGDVRCQMEAIMENLGQILEEAGGGFADIIKIRMFLTDIRHLPQVIDVRSSYLGANKPTATAVEVSALVDPDLLIEVEIDAILD